MAFQITITHEADSQLGALPVREQRMIKAAAAARLQHLPTGESHAIKRLRPNPIAEFELRVGDLRVLYNVEVEESVVVLLLVGRKVGNKLIVGGKEYHGHRQDPPQPAQDGPAGAAQ